MTDIPAVNQIFLLHPDGRREAATGLPGLSVEFRDSGALIEIEAGSVFRDCRAMMGHGARLRIGKTHARGIANTVFDMSGSGRNMRLSLGRGISIAGCRFALTNESRLDVRIGRNCMFSSGITFRATDGHPIFDLETGEVLNHARPIVIGNRVWIGAGVTVLKGSEVASGTVIGSCAVVAGRFPEENTAIGGNPARVLRRNIGWNWRTMATYLRSQARPPEHPGEPPLD